MGKLGQIAISGILLAGAGLFTVFSGCASEEEAMYANRLGTMDMMSPDATVQEAEAMVFAGMKDESPNFISGASDSSRLKVIYYLDGTVLVPALTAAKIKKHYSDGSVGTGTLKVKNGRSLFWEDQSGSESIMNFGIHVKNERILSRDNLHWFSINGTSLNSMVE